MSESKIVLTERLRREGRWAEASKFKDNLVAKLRADGMKRAEAADAAWTAMAEAFLPLSGDRISVEVVDGTTESLSAVAGPIPWRDLPTEAKFDDEIRWVHQQYILIFEDNPNGPVIHWDRATTKPPSTGACSLARWAAENRTAFYKDLVPKTMARPNAPQENWDNNEEVPDPGIAEVEMLLLQINEEMDAELKANVEEALQRRVRVLVSDWMKKHDVQLRHDVQKQLNLGICSLIGEASRALKADVRASR